MARGKLVESIISCGSETTRQTTLLVTQQADCFIPLNTNIIRLSNSILGNNIHGSEVILPVYTTEPKQKKLQQVSGTFNDLGVPRPFILFL